MTRNGKTVASGSGEAIISAEVAQEFAIAQAGDQIRLSIRGAELSSFAITWAA